MVVMSTILIPVQGSEEVVEVSCAELPDDANYIVAILQAEMAPLDLWLKFAVEYYKQGRLEQFKLLTLRTAWLIDRNPKNYKPVRKDIAAVKVSMADTNESIVTRAQRIHGGLGFTPDLPLAGCRQ